MIEKQEPTLICDGVSDGEDRCGEQNLCTVAFEEPTLRELNGSVSRWLVNRPEYEFLSFSHAVETRWKKGPMSNPQPIPAFTGLLVVRFRGRAA
jgi:hypothetical protein